MPLFDFQCRSCKHRQEHFVYPDSAALACPKCSSADYRKRFSSFRMNVEYANTSEYLEKKFNPEMQDLYRQIGKETINEDSKTLDNLFGEDKVRATYGDED